MPNDAVIDTHGGGYVQQAIGPGVAPERISTIIDFARAEKVGAKTKDGSEITSAAVLAEPADVITAGELTIPIAATYPLEQVHAAYSRLAERHTRGKIVLQVRPA